MTTIVFPPPKLTQRAILVLEDQGNGSTGFTVAYNPPLEHPETSKSPCVQTALLLAKLLNAERVLREQSAIRVVEPVIPSDTHTAPDAREELANLIGLARRHGRTRQLMELMDELAAVGSIPSGVEELSAENLRDLRVIFERRVANEAQAAARSGHS